MKKVKIDIPLELYTDNVRKIIERSLRDLNTEPPYIASYLCDPKFTRTYASLGCFVTAWIPLPEPYRPDDSMEDEERLVL